MAGVPNTAFSEALMRDTDAKLRPEVLPEPERPSIAAQLRSDGIDIGDGTDTAPIDIGLRKGGPLSDSALAGMVGQNELGPAGLKDFTARLGIAAGDTPGEKMASWAASHPGGELKVIDQGNTTDPVLLYRENPSKDFARVDSPSFEFGDIADFIGDDIGSILGEVVALIGRGKTRKVSDLWRVFMGTTVGEFGQETVDIFRGVQQEDVTEFGGRALLKGGAAAGTAKFGEKLLDMPIDLVRGAGILRVSDRAAEANRAAQDLIGEHLPTNVISNNPLLRALGGQARLNPGLNRKYEELDEKVFAALDSKMQLAQAEKLVDELAAANIKNRRRVVDRLEKSFEKATPEKAGAAARQGVAEYSSSSGKAVSNAILLARKYGDVDYNIDNLQLEARTVLAGNRAVRKEPGYSSDELATALATGIPPSRVQETMRIGAPGESGVAAIAKQILDLDPKLPSTVNPKGETFTSTDQLRALRTALYEYSKALPGVVSREDEVIAGKLRAAINKTLDAPISKNKRVVKLYKKANRMARIRFNTLERMDVISLAKSETPSVIAKKIFHGDTPVETINVLRRIIPADKFKVVQDGFKTEILTDLYSITASLQKMDQGTLRRLVPPDQIAALKQIGRRFDDMTQIGIQKTLHNQSKASGVVRDLVNRDDTKAIELLQDFVKRAGGANSQLGQTLDAALVEDIVKGATKIDEGRLLIDPKVLRGRLDELKRTGAIGVLSKHSQKTLGDGALVQEFLNIPSDVGALMARASASRQIVSLGKSGLSFFAQNLGIGRVLTGPIWRKVLVGSGTKQIHPSRVLKALAGGVGAINISPEGAEEVNKILSNFVDSTAVEEVNKILSNFVDSTAVEEVNKILSNFDRQNYLGVDSTAVEGARYLSDKWDNLAVPAPAESE